MCTVSFAPAKMSTLYLFNFEMERNNLGYSMKKIPIGSDRSYNLQLVGKIEQLIKTMRWKAITFFYSVKSIMLTSEIDNKE